MVDALLSLPEVMRQVSLSRASIYRWSKTGRFPRPREIAPDCVRWLQSEITEWMHALPTTNTTKTSRAKKAA